MKNCLLIFIGMVTLCLSFKTIETKDFNHNKKRFNIEKDLLLVQFDFKTDVDDLHTVAAFKTLLSHSDYSTINYHAVAGTYGIQGGLYVPPNDLMQLAFENNWTDAHNNIKPALEKVLKIVKETLKNEGKIWIAEAGQSDFSAEIVKGIRNQLPEIDTKQHFHIVQHSKWNEESTNPESLEFVKQHTNYNKIPDGNAIGNGTPGFQDAKNNLWRHNIDNPKLIAIWELATDLANKYNGKDQRYKNPAISAGGLDFSDLSEVCWLLGLEDIKNTEEFFNLFSK